MGKIANAISRGADTVRIAAISSVLLVALLTIIVVAASCGRVNNNETLKNPAFRIGGTVSGLTGTLVLQDNGADDLTLSANGSFVFAISVANGATYAVTVKTQPAGLTCSIAHGSGTVNGADVAGVTVICSAEAYTVSGTVSGLSGTLVLQNNAADDLTLTADGVFTFATSVASGATYAVTVKISPAGLTCSVANGSGTVDSGNVAGVTVVCSTESFTVGGTVSGLSGTLVLQNNAADDLTLTADGAFTFATPVASGATYAVTVKTSPAGLTCSVANGSGTVEGDNVAGVIVVCSAESFTVGGTVSGLSGTLVLQNNAADNLTLTADGAFTFATPVASGAQPMP